MSTLTVPFVMRRAAAVIGIRGWHQGGYYDDTQYAAGTPLDECPVDVLGAINVAVGNEPNDPVGAFRFSDILAGVLAELFGLRDIATWNDTAGRVADEVAGLLEEAAVRAEHAEAGAR